MVEEESIADIAPRFDEVLGEGEAFTDGYINGAAAMIGVIALGTWAAERADEHEAHSFGRHLHDERRRGSAGVGTTLPKRPHDR